MTLAPGLILRQSQSLVMTPQLMQSIRLLQMTHLELARFIEQEIERNPLLEPADDENGQDRLPAAADYPTPDEERAPRGDSDEQADLYDSATSGDADRPGDSFDGGLDNLFPDDAGPRAADAPELLGQWKSMPGGEGGEAADLDTFLAYRKTLRDVIEEQIAFLFDNPADRLVALHFLDHLDDAGYLRGTPAEAALRLGVAETAAERVLARLQEAEPTGVFARSLGECLALQLRARDRLDPAMATLIDNLDLLARRDFTTLGKLCGVDEEDLIDMLAEIRALDPRPGLRFETASSETVVPDVLVSAAADGSWQVELNPDALPRVLVNRDYYAAVSSRASRDGRDKAFLDECLQTANWLTRSLDQRARTILKVASEIVRRQDAFLIDGIRHLRPLTLKAVADAIGMHESTISRVTANKYMLTPRGLFELKYFFTVSIGSAEGGDTHSAESVRHHIRTLIAAETADSVLSDDDIVTRLGEEGVKLARRTVAKYRDTMNIPSSVERRREKKARARAGNP